MLIMGIMVSQLRFARENSASAPEQRTAGSCHIGWQIGEPHGRRKSFVVSLSALTACRRDAACTACLLTQPFPNTHAHHDSPAPGGCPDYWRRVRNKFCGNYWQADSHESTTLEECKRLCADDAACTVISHCGSSCDMFRGSCTERSSSNGWTIFYYNRPLPGELSPSPPRHRGHTHTHVHVGGHRQLRKQDEHPCAHG